MTSRLGDSKLAAAGAAFVLIVVALAGFLLGHRGDDARDAAAAPRQVVSGPFALSVPADWRAPGVAASLPGLELEDRVALAPPGKASRSALIVGVAPSDDPSLLPGSVRQRVGLVAPAAAARLSRLESLRYDDLPLPGAPAAIELFASPIRGGALTAVCLGDDPGFKRSCESAVATLRLTRGAGYSLGADTRFATGVDRVMEDLNTRRERGVAAMRDARRAAGQAVAADTVADAYAGAAERIAIASDNPTSLRTRTALVRGLNGASTAWRRLARAAERQSSARYAFERFSVDSSERWVDLLARTADDPPPPIPSAPPAASAATPSTAAAGVTTSPKPCSATHAETALVPAHARGLVRICRNADGSSSLVKNISHLVIAVFHSGNAAPMPYYPQTFSGKVELQASRPGCAGTRCTMPPGAAVRIDGGGQSLTFAVAREDSVSVVVAGGLARAVESRLTPAAKRAPQMVMGCVEGLKKTYESQNIEELGLNMANEGPGCASLFKNAGIEDAAERQSVARDIVKRIRGAGGGALNEVGLILLKNGIGAIR